MDLAFQVSNKSIKKIIIRNFFGGIAWGLGITVGATLILAVGTFLLSRLNYVPVIGNLVISVNEFVTENDPNL